MQTPAKEQVGRRPDGSCVPCHPMVLPTPVPSPTPSFQASLLPTFVTLNWQPPDPGFSTAFVSRQEGSEVVKRLRRFVDPGLG